MIPFDDFVFQTAGSAMETTRRKTKEHIFESVTTTMAYV
jgi:hypothetical protein